MPRCMSTKTKQRSCWCTETVIGLLAEPLAARVLEDGCLEVVTFYINGAESRLVLCSALLKQSWTLKFGRCGDAELDASVGRTSTLGEPISCKGMMFHHVIGKFETLGHANNVVTTSC